MEAIVFLHYTVRSSGFEYICVLVICFWEKGGGKDDGRIGRGKVYRGRKKEGERKKPKGKNREKEDGTKGVLGETGWKARTCEEGRGRYREERLLWFQSCRENSIFKSKCVACLPGLKNVNKRHGNNLKRVSLWSWKLADSIISLLLLFDGDFHCGIENGGFAGWGNHIKSLFLVWLFYRSLFTILRRVCVQQT